MCSARLIDNIIMVLCVDSKFSQRSGEVKDGSVEAPSGKTDTLQQFIVLAMISHNTVHALKKIRCTSASMFPLSAIYDLPLIQLQGWGGRLLLLLLLTFIACHSSKDFKVLYMVIAPHPQHIHLLLLFVFHTHISR